MQLQDVPTEGLDEKYRDWIGFIAETHHASDPRVNDPVPFAVLTRPLAEARVALLTTAGAHLDDQVPFHIETVAGDPSFREIPNDVDVRRIRFTHTHYDTSSAAKDPNVVLPITRLAELVERGRIGSASPVHFGMMGFNPNSGPVADELGPTIAERLVEHEVDVALFVPG